MGVMPARNTGPGCKIGVVEHRSPAFENAVAKPGYFRFIIIGNGHTPAQENMGFFLC
jgi:hypothetical protein